jgi:hypothetical protein
MCSLLALTIAAQPPMKVTGVPSASNAGQGDTLKSSPSASWTAGIAHSPPHCMAVRPWLKAPGSCQSVGAPTSSPSDWRSSRNFS